MWMTLDQIEYLQIVSETGSITKASEVLLRSKSAVANGIQNLEEQLGFKLLDRSEYRAKLTPEGKSFLHKAQVVLKEVEELKQASVLIASKVEAKLSLSVSGIFESKKLYSIIKEATKLFPSTEIVLHRETLSGEKMLFNESVDLAIFEVIKNKRDLDYKEIAHVDLKLVIGANHPYLNLPKKEKTIKALYKYPQIVQRSTLPDESLNLGVHKDSLKWFVTDTASKKEIIQTGLGWGRLPLHEIEGELQKGKLIHLKEINDDDQIEMYIAKRKDYSLGKVATFIWDNI